jgi:SET domain-containing protein
METKHSELAEVRESKIHNKGVFAKKDIPKGTYIIEYLGRKISNDEADEISERETTAGVIYLFELDKDTTIDGDVPWNPAKYINHSCEPNADSINDDEHIWIEATRDIKKDEEITYDYCLDTDDFEDHPCRCGSKNCKGYLTTKNKK